jgi:HK97 family phage major capsid protein
MPSNQELINKADIALSDLASNGGMLLPEQADKFIRVLIEQPTILNMCRVVTMNSPQRKINKIGFGSRIMHAATSGTALADADRVKPDLSQISLNTKEVIAEIHLPYDVLEDNIEGGNISVPLQTPAGGLHDTITQLIAERAALDLEELILLGDTTLSATDAYLGLMDGFLKKCNAHMVDGGGTSVSKNQLKNALKAMPPKYLRDRGSLNFFSSVNNETELRDTYASRNTPFGDTTLQGFSPLMLYGSPVQPVPLMPENKILLTNPMNLIFGVQRKINIEYTKDIRARCFIIVLTCRVDCAVEESRAATQIFNLGQ